MQPVILCIDDEKMVLDSLETQLYAEFGREYPILLAESGAEALEICGECRAGRTEVAVIIADYMMPGMNGVRLLQLAQQQFPAALKIMLTGRADLAAVVRAVNQADLYRYLAKPWEQNDLLLTVREALARYQMQGTIKRQCEELQALNRDLELKVAARTQELAIQTGLFRQVFTNTPEAMALFDRETTVLEVNPAFEALFQYSAATLKDVRLQVIVPEEWQADSALLAEAIFNGKTARRETTRLKRDGQIVPVALLAYPISLGSRGSGGIAVYQELTAQKQTERILRQAYERRRRTNFLNDLAANPRIDIYECRARAQLLGMELGDARSVYYLKLISDAGSEVDSGRDCDFNRRVLQDEVVDWLSGQPDWQAWQFRDGIGMVVRRGPEAAVDLALEKQDGLAVLDRLATQFPNVRIVLGSAAFAPDWENFGGRCRQARDAVLIGMKLYPAARVHHYWDFGAYSVLTKLADDAEAECFLQRTLGELLHYDAVNGTELFATLKQILAHENLRAVADALFIHYKTALFRKRSIEKILGLSLDSFEGRTMLATALVLYSVRELKDQL
jgi:PAS domain S-box-containing protein